MSKSWASFLDYYNAAAPFQEREAENREARQRILGSADSSLRDGDENLVTTAQDDGRWRMAHAPPVLEEFTPVDVREYLDEMRQSFLLRRDGRDHAMDRDEAYDEHEVTKQEVERRKPRISEMRVLEDRYLMEWVSGV